MFPVKVSRNFFRLKSSSLLARLDVKRPSARYTSTMHDNDPELLELEKQRNLSLKQHRTSTPHQQIPGWNEHLATASEASVKADQVDTSSLSEMQNQTVSYIRNRHSAEDNSQSESVVKDEVSGPLSQLSELRDHVAGPLSGAPGVEDNEPGYIVKKTVTEKTEVYRPPGT
ncbi:hypothetical protein C8J56DRAFT_930709 [Mycena floridula]|nr:hypothetical protein C8J56DRAFT_930709 [Mycena floridula]